MTCQNSGRHCSVCTAQQEDHNGCCRLRQLKAACRIQFLLTNGDGPTAMTRTAGMTRHMLQHPTLQTDATSAYSQQLRLRTWALVCVGAKSHKPTTCMQTQYGQAYVQLWLGSEFNCSTASCAMYLQAAFCSAGLLYNTQP